jgi:ParB/RepB/Spo0J family partition protein
MSNEIILLDPNTIEIAPDRYRKIIKNIDSLTESIKTLGKNIVPINVILTDGKPKLVAGHRRTLACRQAGVMVRATVETLDTVDERIYEITENLEREDFTWQEKVEATADLAKLLEAKYGKLTVRQFSEKSGLSIGAISTDLGLAEALKADPEMFVACKTRDSALKVLQKFKIDETKAELALRKQKTNYGAKAKNHIFFGGCNNLIESLPNNVVDAMITDHPYGLDLKNAKKQEGVVDAYEDDETAYFPMIVELLQKSSRVLKADAAICMFCRVENFAWLREEIMKHGFAVDSMPGIWYRTGSAGQTYSPDKNFARSYEVFAYGTRGNYSLVKQGASNVIPCSGVNPSEKLHIVQKPLALMEELVQRFCLPGSVILDPFAGSATTVIAGLKFGCKALGFEKDEGNYQSAIIRVADFLSAKDAGVTELGK